MNETKYHLLADAVLERLAQVLEKADQDALIELESNKDMVSVALDDGRQFIISKHTASRQVWLSSPVSGGLHFRYDESHNDWRLPSGESLEPLLMAELKQLAGVNV